MKQLLIIALFFAFNSLSQSNDTTCIKQRWISIKNTPENAVFFPNKQSGINEFDLFLFVLNKAKSDEIEVYTEWNDYNKCKWYPIPDFKMGYLPLNIDSLKAEIKLGHYEIEIEQSDMPIVNMYGKDSVIQIKGVNHYVYPPSLLLKMSVYDVNEIRVLEERYYDSVKKSFIYRPVAMSFFEKRGVENGVELFSIQISNITNNIVDSKKYAWYKALIERKYVGFQYLQISCYDDVIRK